MKITVRVHPKSNKNEVQVIQDGDFEVYTCAPPVKNLANKAVVELLAAFFKISKSQICILAGHTSRNKIVKVNI